MKRNNIRGFTSIRNGEEVQFNFVKTRSVQIWTENPKTRLNETEEKIDPDDLDTDAVLRSLVKLTIGPEFTHGWDFGTRKSKIHPSRDETKMFLKEWCKENFPEAFQTRLQKILARTGT